MIALKRISKDIQEITKNPVEGIGIIQYEDDNLKFIVNIKLMYGIYKDFCLQKYYYSQVKISITPIIIMFSMILMDFINFALIYLKMIL